MKEWLSLVILYILCMCGLLSLICVTVEAYLNGEGIVILLAGFVCSMLTFMMNAIVSIMREIK